MKTTLCLSFTLFAIFSTCFCQNSTASKWEKKLDKLITGKYKSIAPGCAVLVSTPGQPVYKKAYGIANLEWGTPMTAESVFRIGSITKEFTGIAILQLVEQAKILLDDSLQKYIDYFPYKGHRITIENLLTHTSGIMDFQSLDFNIPNAIRVDFPPKRIIDSLKDRPLLFVPGAQYGYSNTNYFLLGMIIEKISGQAYGKYMEERIIRPLNLSHTRYDEPARLIKLRSNGYRKEKDEFVNADYLSMNWPFAAGALLSTVGDLHKWHDALISNKIVKKETFDKATSRFILADGRPSQYGYGFFVQEWDRLKNFGHAGAIDGFRAVEMYYPDTQIYLALLINSEEDGYLALFEELYKAVIPDKQEKEKVSENTLKSYVGTYSFEEDSSQSVKIYMQKETLFANLSNGSGVKMKLVPRSNGGFVLPDVRRVETTIEFIAEGNKITGLYWIQEATHRASKMP